MPKKGRCKYPECTSEGPFDGHHVTYRPRCVFSLCRQHHREVTILNVNAADAQRKRLSNKHRWWIFGAWLRGELTPVMTPAAERWLRSWKD